MSISKKNASGAYDLTAHEALSNISVGEAETLSRLTMVIHLLKSIIQLGGFELTARIELRDIKTGRVYK